MHAEQDEEQDKEKSWGVEEAAEFLKISVKKAYDLAASGAIPSFKVGGSRRFTRVTLVQWRAAQISGGGK